MSKKNTPQEKQMKSLMKLKKLTMLNRNLPRKCYNGDEKNIQIYKNKKEVKLKFFKSVRKIINRNAKNKNRMRWIDF